MSVTAMALGKLQTDPEMRWAGNGNPYTLARMVAHDGEAHTLVSLIAFGQAADQLAALGKGDALAVSGPARIKLWNGQDGSTHAGLNITVDSVLSTYGLKRKRDAWDQFAPASAPAGPQRGTDPSTSLPPTAEVTMSSAADAAWLGGSQ